jgi:hypothetical protein
MIRALQKERGHAHLRFAFLQDWTYASLRYAFVVYDASRGPCIDTAGGYPVLNDNSSGRLFYEPGEDPYFIKSTPP